MTFATISPRELERLREECSRMPGEPPIKGLLTAKQIMNTVWPEPVWAVPDYLPAGLCILAGKPKVGKSWLAFQIAMAVASGGRALGKRCTSGPVLYLALEDPERRLQTRMFNQQWQDSYPVEFMPLGFFQDEVGYINQGGSIKLAAQIAAVKYRMVVIDTLSRAIAGDQNEVDQMTSALTPLQEVAHEFNCAVLVIDHHKKGSMDQDAVGDILGSTAKGAMADCAWGLYRERGKHTASLSIIGRDVIEVTLALSFNAADCLWESEGDADALKRTGQINDLITIVESAGEKGMTLTDIADAVERNRGTVLRELNGLVTDSIVRRIGNKKGLRFVICNDGETE